MANLTWAPCHSSMVVPSTAPVRYPPRLEIAMNSILCGEKHYLQLMMLLLEKFSTRML